MHALLAILLAMPAQAETGRYVGDDTSGSLKFDMEASLHDVPGQAKSFTTELLLDEKVTGKVVVQTKSMTTGIGVRDTRMYEYCLETDKYPTIEFKVRGITGDTEGFHSEGGTGKVDLHGTLMVRSTQRDVTIPATYTWIEEGLYLEGKKDIKWTDFGVPDPSIVISKLDPKMAVRFEMTLKKSL